MRPTTLILVLLAITVVAWWAAEIATRSVNINGLSSFNESAAKIIKERCPIHLVRPEWVSNDSSTSGDPLINWYFAEIKARLGLVTILWLVSISIILWQNAKKRRAREASKSVS